ncbi:MAG: DUF523 domain-containing protein [Clostridiales bacterium]|nr:DUF523 domain-containing protein [Clostridiales bacterium]
MIVVSKCLTGCPCRYDGKSKPDPAIAALVLRGEAIAVCPEQLGGLPTPRVSAELTGTGGDVLDGKARAVTRDGRDVTEAFVKGAYEALRIAKKTGAERAILKSKSPSCGCGAVYDGSFTGSIVPGDGVAAALFKRNGIIVEVSDG